MGLTAYGERTRPGDPANDGSLDHIARSIRITDDDLDWWFTLADDLKWTYASSMPSTPHSYVIRGKGLDVERYLVAFAVIRTFGAPGMFHGRPQTYLIDNSPGPFGKGRRWWLMSTHFWQSQALNMATDGKTYGPQTHHDTSRPLGTKMAMYDQIGAFYDDLYRADDKRDQQLLWNFMTGQTGMYQPTVLDLGAGTGATLQAAATHPRNVTAVDPATSMLNDLFVYHPNVGRIINATAEEYIDETKGETFDLVVASNGSASYLSAEVFEAIPDLLNPQGRAIMSFYRDDPPAHAALGITVDDLPNEKPAGTGITSGMFETYLFDKKKD